LLVQCGAHLTVGSHTIGEMLCGAAARGNLQRLNSLALAGVDLNQPDISNRTALHLATQHNMVISINFCPIFYEIYFNLFLFNYRKILLLGFWRRRFFVTYATILE
jgi:ankyrin repeat protein